VHKISGISLILLVILLGLIQATSFDYIKLIGIKPDALLVVTVFIALSCSRQETIKTAITAGLIKDVTSASVLASSVFSFLVIGLIINFHKNKFYGHRISAQAGLSFLSYIFASVLIAGFNALAYRQVDLFYINLNGIVKGALYTSLIAPIICLISSKVLRIRLEYGL
jgi:rod shape-determining protein MreD